MVSGGDERLSESEEVVDDGAEVFDVEALCLEPGSMRLEACPEVLRVG
jgi:hypothetical protein